MNRLLHLILNGLLGILLSALGTPQCHGQAALLMEEPYGFYGAVNPTGHVALYFSRICAETPVKLRRCTEDEAGSVISRYQGIDGYDWVAVPLVPYLYAVEDPADVPAHVSRELVLQMRARYRENHLESLGASLSPGNIVHGGWTQLAGIAYQRRIFAFRFATTAEQDDALIARMNWAPNRSHFNTLYSNCADFARGVMNAYFPHAFRRRLFPDAEITTPKQVAYSLVRYARKHPQTALEVLEIPLVPGDGHLRRANNDVSEAFFTTGYAVPLALVHPVLAGGLLVDYLSRGRYHLVPKHPDVLTPKHLEELTGQTLTARSLNPENSHSAGEQVPGVAENDPAETQESHAANFGLPEIKAKHE